MISVAMLLGLEPAPPPVRGGGVISVGMLLGLEPLPKPPVPGRTVLNLSRPGRQVPLVPLAPGAAVAAARSAAGLPRTAPASGPGHLPAHLRSTAQRLVWAALEDGPATAAELGTELGLAPNRVSAILCRWRDAGLVRVTTTMPTGNSRPAQLFERLEEE